MNILYRFKYPIILIITALIIAFLNYTPNTWLSGWDTLHPELDYNLNFSRLISGVWRDDQGLGSVAGHSHMSDLPRVGLLYLFDLVLPTSAVRYAYIFLMYILGPLGIYFLLRTIFHTSKHKNILGFLAALYYMLNAGAIQQFYVPFEMFPTQFGYLPWIMLFTLKSLHTFSKKNLIIFSLLTLLATPQAYAAQLWYAFFGTYLIFMLLYVLFAGKNRLKNASRGMVLIVLTLLINSFWLLPNVYYIATQGDIPRQSKQNRLYSQEFRLKNREFGKLQDIALLKGFYFNWDIYNPTDKQFNDLMSAWKQHYANPLTLAIGFSIFAMVLFGLFHTIKNASKTLIPFLPFFALPFILLANRVVPFSLLFDQLIRIPLFEEALRFVFTKFSILLLFSYTIFFTASLAYVLEKLDKKKAIVGIVCTLLLLIYLGLPVVHNGLISERLRIKVPAEYTDMWEFMATQPKGTMVSLPLHTFSGWQHYAWGYQGSGFVWFPLSQPLLDRDSDRWNSLNEESFRELQYALYTKNAEKFIATIKKYNITYVFWDRNNTTTEEKNQTQITFDREIKIMLDELVRNGKLSQTWTSGNLEIYRYISPHSRIEVITNIPNILPSYQWGFDDAAYNTYGVYKSDTTVRADVFYPFRDYLNGYDRFNKNLISIDGEKQLYTINIPQADLFKSKVIAPNIDVEQSITADVYLQKISPNKSVVILKPILPQQHNISATIVLKVAPIDALAINGNVFAIQNTNTSDEPLLLGRSTFNLHEQNIIDGQSYAVAFDVNIEDLARIESSLPPEFMRMSAEDIYKANNQNSNVSLMANDEHSNFLRITSEKKDTTGVLIDLSTLSQSSGYVISLSTRNVLGIPLRICLFSLYSNICTLYDEASKNAQFSDDTFIIPPYTDTNGYSLRIDNITYGNEKTVNDIEAVSVFPIPYNFLSQTRVESDFGTPQDKVASTFKPYFNYTLYAVEVSATQPNKESELIFWRAFNDGWVAVDVKKMKLLPNHHTINNWANGWTIEPKVHISGEPIHIIIFFWPQLLQYAGYALLISALLGVGIFVKKRH